MPHIYEVPTHLQVEDVLIAGLTAHQLVRLMVGASLAYGLWDQTASLPPLIRLGAAAVVALSGLLLALVRPGGRPLDQWVLAGLLFVILPRRRVWRRSASNLQVSHAGNGRGWAELAPRPDWIHDDDLSAPGMASSTPSRRQQ
jgi:hypothetical protein